MRFLFFLMAFPIMMMSFFEVSDVVPMAQTSLIVDGNQIELTQTQQTDLNEQICGLFEGSRTLPCYCVCLHDEFVQSVQSGSYICLNFPMPLDVNGMPFDQLVFELDSDATSVNLCRGNHGIFQGRCLCVGFADKTMQELCEFVENLDLNESVPEEEVEEVEDGEDVDESNEENVEEISDEKNLNENQNDEENQNAESEEENSESPNFENLE